MIEPSSLQFTHYDVVRGIVFILALMAFVCLVAYIILWKYSYQFFALTDNTHRRNKSQSPTAFFDILLLVKIIIFSILGYRGEQRERQSISEIDHTWVSKNLGSIFWRLFIFYFIFIWSLILTTRAVYFLPDGSITVLDYTKNAIFGFIMILLYIVSNSIFDILSLRWTLFHLEKIGEYGISLRSLWYAARDLSFAAFFFSISQIFGNIIWPLKTNVDISWLERPFSAQIALWPYAFVFDASADTPSYLNILFPGQLLVTGTVFFPTIIAIIVIVATLIAAAILNFIKNRLTDEEKRLIGIELEMSPSGQPTYSFRCLNSASVGLATSIIGSFVFSMFNLVFHFI